MNSDLWIISFCCVAGEQEGAENRAAGGKEEGENRKDQVPADSCQGRHLCRSGTCSAGSELPKTINLVAVVQMKDKKTCN